ncbi:MAG: RNA chaperone Hfq [Acidobacteriota bacterium]
MEKAVQNLQDNFLNQARRERMLVTIYLLSGVKLTGKIKGFDKYSVILDSGNQEQLIFKHAISTVALPRGVSSKIQMGDSDEVVAKESAGGTSTPVPGSTQGAGVAK